MDKLNHHIKSIMIENFRAFKHLEIERLAQINLITGPNNIGKSCLLEALWLYVSGGHADVIKQILLSRNEFDRKGLEGIKSVKHLFYRDETISMLGVSPNPPLHMGIDKDNVYRMLLSFSRFSYKERQIAEYYRHSKYQILNSDFTENTMANWELKNYPHQFIPSKGLTHQQISGLWDKIDMTPLQDDVRRALSVIEPNIKGVGLVTNERLPMARIGGEFKPVLLSSMGEGMNRIFELALALVNAKDGFLMIDEVENGLYHAIQYDLWDFIFKVAKQLNVQVFVTTHSNDTIESFAEINSKHDDIESVLVSLRKVRTESGRVVGIVIDEDELEYAVHENVEVR